MTLKRTIEVIESEKKRMLSLAKVSKEIPMIEGYMQTSDALELAIFACKICAIGERND